PLSLPLVVGEEKRLVLLDGTAQRGAELIQIELFLGCRKKAAGVQLRVAEKLKHRAVKLVGSGFRGHEHGGTRTRTIFCRIIVSKDLELLDSVNRRQNGDSTRCQFVVVVAIQQPIRALRARSTHRQRVSPAGGNFTTGASVKET